MQRVLALYSTLAVGGAERQLALLVPELSRSGFDVVVATLRERGRHFEELQDRGTTTAHAAMRSATDVFGAARALRLSKMRPDIVLTHGTDALCIGHVVSRRASCSHVAVEQAGPGIPRGRRRAALRRLLAPRIDRAVAVSEAQIPELRGLGYRAEAIRVIPNAAADISTARPASDVRRELGITDDEVLLLLVAGMRPEKRPDVFVDAVALARRRDRRIRGVIAGGGALLGEFRQRDNGNGVELLGERSDVRELMEGADVVCLSSDVEGVPLALLEAMAARRPVIATHVGGVPEVVLHGETGLLVPPRDPATFAEAMVELAGLAERRKTLGAAARARFEERFTVGKMAARYIALFREL